MGRDIGMIGFIRDGVVERNRRQSHRKRRGAAHRRMQRIVAHNHRVEVVGICAQIERAGVGVTESLGLHEHDLQ